MLNRRDLIKAFAAGSIGWSAGCGSAKPIAGGFVGPSAEIGHRIRDGLRITPGDGDWEEVDAVIIGGGVAGLSAARRLVHGGVERIVLLELESEIGGTSLGGESSVTRFPWGAHYLPVPLRENQPLVALLDEMRVLERIEVDGTPIVAEQFLCRDPQERLFADGRWHEGLIPDALSSEQDRADFAAFQAEIDRWVAWRDKQGRRAFTIPSSAASDDPLCTALDQISFDDWRQQQSFQSEQLRWMLDYACRDDYGSTIEQTSAWAGLFYFASRQPAPGEHSQPLITWPEGNARIVHHLADSLGDRLRSGVAITEIRADENSRHVDVIAFDTTDDRTVAHRARQVILATPQFLAPYLIADFPQERADASRQFEYAPWLVANLHLSDRPASAGFPLSWDNVFRDSESLGYVTATHQAGNDYGPTVLTYYLPLCDDDPRAARQRLLEMTWPDACDLILSDMEQAHRDIRELVDRIDIMRWGHGMIRPRTGFIWSDARRRAAQPWRGIHFANTDLSGVALFEEAFHHGIRAAEEVLQAVKSRSI